MNSTISDKRGNFTIIENELIHNYDLSPLEGWLYVVLLSHANRQTGVAFPGYGRLARLAGMSRKTVQRTIESLILKGLISKTTRWNGINFESNEYTFNSLRTGVSQTTPVVSQTIPYGLTDHTPMVSQTIPIVSQTSKPESLTKRNNQRDVTSTSQTAESLLEKTIRNRRAKP